MSREATKPADGGTKPGVNAGLGLEVPGWPPENIEELARRVEEPY